METELETIKMIHVANQGFEWKYEVKENPEFPGEAILIRQHEEGKIRGEVSIPRGALENLKKAIDEFI